MTDIARLEEALRAADAAGDTEAATQFAEAIRAAQTEAHTPAAPPRQDRGFGVLAESRRTLGKAEVSAGPEIPARLWAGLKATGAAFKDMYNVLVAKNSTGNVPSARFPNDRSALSKVHAEELLRQTLSEAEAKEQGVDLKTRETLVQGGMAAATSLAPEVGLPKTTTLLGGAVKNAVGAAAGSALTPDTSDDSKIDDILIAGGAGPIIGFLPSLPAAVKNTVGAALRAAQNTRTGAAVAAAARRLSNTTFSLAQRTGIPALNSLERGAYNGRLTQFYADQTDTAIADAVDVLRTPVNEDILADAAVANRTRLSQQLANMQTAANDGWNAGLAHAAELGSRAVGVHLPVDNLRAQWEVTRQVMGDNVAHLIKGGVPANAANVLSTLTGDNVKGLTPRGLASLLQGLTQMSKAGDPALRATARDLRRSLNLDMDALQGNGQLAMDDATKQILETRAEYARAMTAKKLVAQSAHAQLFGIDPKKMRAKDDAQITVEDLMSRFNGMDTTRQTQVRRFLSEHDPETLLAMRSRQINEIASRARGGVNPAADPNTNAVANFMQGLDEQLKVSGLWSPADRVRMQEVKDGLSVVLNNRPSFGGAGTVMKGEDILPNVVSRSPIFVTRQLARFISGNMMDRLFVDPRYYDILSQINRSTTGSVKNLTARAALIKMLSDEEPEQQEEAQ